jgi:hypothetical protein
VSLQLEWSQRIINGVTSHHGGVKNCHQIVTGLPGLTHPLPFWPRDNIVWAGCIWLVIFNFGFILFGVCLTVFKVLMFDNIYLLQIKPLGSVMLVFGVVQLSKARETCPILWGSVYAL